MTHHNTASNIKSPNSSPHAHRFSFKLFLQIISVKNQIQPIGTIFIEKDIKLFQMQRCQI